MIARSSISSTVFLWNQLGHYFNISLLENYMQYWNSPVLTTNTVNTTSVIHTSYLKLLFAGVKNVYKWFCILTWNTEEKILAFFKGTYRLLKLYIWPLVAVKRYNDRKVSQLKFGKCKVFGKRVSRKLEPYLMLQAKKVTFAGKIRSRAFPIPLRNQRPTLKAAQSDKVWVVPQ